MNENPKYGDERFRKYMEENNKNLDSDPFTIILKNIRFKIDSIVCLYVKCLETYVTLNEKDSLKTVLNEFIVQLNEHFTVAMDQLSYNLSDEEDEEDIAGGEKHE